SLVLLAHLDPQGRPLYLSAVARDIGDLKRVASQLSIAQSIARMGSWDHDLEKGDLMWSEETCRIFGLPPGEPVTFAKFWSFIHPEDGDRVRAASEEAQRTGKPYRVEHRIVRPDGSERFVEERAEVRYDRARRPVRLIGTVQDVTDQRRLEEQLRHAQRMDAVGRLAGGVAHDFNNLLTVICGHAENLRSSLAGRPELLESADEILKAGGRATSLTRQLLSFGRQSVMAVRTLSVNTVVEDLRKMLVRLLGDVVDLRLDLDGNLWNIDADPSKLEQVIVNLVLNARDATADGGRVVVITRNVTLTQPSSDLSLAAGDYVSLAVADTGCGMDEAVRARIFEPFFTTKPVGKGTGLGLSTVYGIVRQTGGAIGVETRLGYGSTFEVYLPRSLGAIPAEAPLSGSARTVLLVEDEVTVRRLVRQMLAQQGYRILEATDGEDALRLSAAHNGPIDVVLTDVIMPHMSGRDLATHLGQSRPGIRIVWMSAYTDDQFVQAPGQPRVAFLQKPFTVEAL
ncbi:MAG: ATP-binding protein, partial [Bryobacteraceae bacterium]